MSDNVIKRQRALITQNRFITIGGPEAGGGAATNGIDKYTWNILDYRAHNGTARAITDGNGNSALDLATSADVVLDVSTSGLTGIPDNMVDKAQRRTASATNYAKINTGETLDTTTYDTWHIRIIRKVNAISVGYYMFKFHSSSTDYIQAQITSGGAPNFLIRTGGVNHQTTGPAADLTGWSLEDYVANFATGDLTVFINGVESLVPYAGSGEWRPILSNIWVGCWTAHNGTLAPDADNLFQGVRATDTEFSLAEHKTDLAIFGIEDNDP